MHPKPKCKRLRVVTLVDALAARGGGAERVARRIATRLDPERFEVTFCVTRWSDARAADPGAAEAVRALRHEGVGFLGIERDSARQIGAWRPLLSMLRRERIDVLHAHGFGSNAWAAVLGSLARTPVVIAHEHSWSFEGEPLRRAIDRHLIARRAAAVVAVSDADRRLMIELEGLDPAKIVLLRNGIPDPPQGSGSNIREQLGIAPSAPVICTVCVLRPVKALEILIQAAAKLVSQHPDLRVLIVGGGPQRASLEQLIADLGLERTVTLLGPRSDVADLLACCDIGICSSHREGTPLTILEYMDAGLPVVATRVGGIPEMIEDGVHGLLVEPRDPEGLALAVAKLLGDRRRAAEMGRRGRQRRRTEFDIDAMVRRVEKLYEDLVAARDKPR